MNELPNSMKQDAPRDTGIAKKPPGARPAWEIETVDQLIKELGPEFALDVLGTFAGELSQRLSRMHADRTPKHIIREAHALKSTAATFGAQSLSDAAKSLELCNHEVPNEEWDIRVDALLNLGAEVLGAVQKWLLDARGAKK